MVPNNGQVPKGRPHLQDEVPPRPPRVALLYAGNAEHPRSWSGIPVHLTEALRALGVDVRPGSVRLPAPVRAVVLAPLWLVAVLRSALWLRRPRPKVAWRTAHLHPLYARLLGPVARRRAAGADAVIMLGAGYRAPEGAPFITYEDMTVRQVNQHLSLDWRLLSDQAIDARRRIQASCYAVSHACCVTSAWAAESIISEYHVDPARVFVVGIGSRYPVSPVDRDWSTPRFLFVGMDWRRKNGDAIVRAFRAVRAAHPTAELHLVGRHPPVGEQGVIEHGELRLDVAADNERLSRLYAMATCYVMPSVREPSAMAYLEAAAYGVPSIGTRIGGSVELIGDGGVVVDPHDDRELVAAMLRLCDPVVARTLGRRAQENVRDAGWEDVARRLLGALGLEEFDAVAPVSAAQDADLELAPLLPYVPDLRSA